MASISYQPMPPEKTYFVAVRYYLRGRGEPLAFAVVCLCLMMLQGCAMAFPWNDVGDQIEIQRANNPMGCGFIIGGGNPPASRIDGGSSFGWGDGMTIDQMNLCLETLKGMK